MSDDTDTVSPHSQRRLFYQGWVILLLIFAAAAFLRFWQLGDAPPGLYRDEAYNGLDALDVLDGNFAIFFERNNGREPFYIYMVAGAIKFFGRTAYAIRLPAALAGTLTTLFTYAFVSNWFSRRIGLYAAALWAITLWPVHLSRVGFRTILLPLFVALFLWLGTLAVRWGLAQRSNIAAQPKLSQWQGNLLFLAAGFVYGMAFYTYLAVRLTPAFLVGLLIFAALTGRLRGLERGILLAGAGFVLALLPFAGTVLANPDILFGRSGQVSILSPAINGGSVWGALWRHLSGTAAMFVWQGDTILRHNVPGRPVFDWIMAIPFIIGLLWCIWNWRRPAPAATLLWCGSMVWGTILAEDAPHFLRAAGLLPVFSFFPPLVCHN